MKLIIIIVIITGSASVSVAQMSPPSAGKVLFESHCKKCHGVDGTKGLFGAKNLQTSRLNDAQASTIITEGKRIMPSWKRKLTTEEIDLIKEYIKHLRM